MPYSGATVQLLILNMEPIVASILLGMFFDAEINTCILYITLLRRMAAVMEALLGEKTHKPQDSFVSIPNQCDD